MAPPVGFATLANATHSSNSTTIILSPNPNSPAQDIQNITFEVLGLVLAIASLAIAVLQYVQDRRAQPAPLLDAELGELEPAEPEVAQPAACKLRCPPWDCLHC
ncbi:hypothetical protein ACHAQA_001812 [Verticillium albo-atrum]